MKTVDEVRELYGNINGLPFTREAVYWDRRLPASINQKTIDHYLREYTRYLPEGCVFDEAALLAHDESVLDNILKDLTTLGWSVFNLAADVVHTNPMSTRYGVEYVFLRHPERSYRMEVMLLGEKALSGETGFSPLHASLWRESYDRQVVLPVPHLSFKPPATLVDQVGASKAVRIVLDAMRNGPHAFTIAQACQSTYGEFWYMIPNQCGKQLYVKPRINTRDR